MSHFRYVDHQNVYINLHNGNGFSFWGLRPPDPLPGLRPWTIVGSSVPQTYWPPSCKS